jgi:hypothetical protein
MSVSSVCQAEDGKRLFAFLDRTGLSLWPSVVVFGKRL